MRFPRTSLLTTRSTDMVIPSSLQRPLAVAARSVAAVRRSYSVTVTTQREPSLMMRAEVLFWAASSLPISIWQPWSKHLR